MPEYVEFLKFLVDKARQDIVYYDFKTGMSPGARELFFNLSDDQQHVLIAVAISMGQALLGQYHEWLTQQAK